MTVKCTAADAVVLGEAMDTFKVFPVSFLSVEGWVLLSSETEPVDENVDFTPEVMATLRVPGLPDNSDAKLWSLWVLGMSVVSGEALRIGTVSVVPSVDEDKVPRGEFATVTPSALNSALLSVRTEGTIELGVVLSEATGVPGDMGEVTLCTGIVLVTDISFSSEVETED